MYPEYLVAPMRTDLTGAGFTELLNAEDVKSAVEAEGTTFVVVNSVCGCAAGAARPGIKIAIENGIIASKLLTVFAGQEVDAVSKLRTLCHGFAPSSPAIAFFKGGKVQSMIERRDIEGYNKLQIAEKIVKHCAELA